MSLQEFTWQQFLVAAMVFSALWVLGVWLFYWRPLSGGGEKAGDALPHSWQDDVDEFSAVDDGLMGKPALDHGVSVLDADEFSFMPLEERGEGLEPEEPDLLGELADVQDEIKGICQILEKEDGSKEDFLALFEVVRLKYPKLSGSDLLGELNDFISEQVPFYLSDQELDSLWV
ncbi:hypothetical protein D3C87_50110 [compost metagenome]